MKFAVARKIGMTRVFNKEGNELSVTLLSAMPIKVSRLISEEKNGYNAVVVEEIIEDKKDKKIKVKRYEFKLDEKSDLKIGDEVKIDQFKPNDIVTVIGRGKGKGFSGAIKRHNFSRGPKTHGSDHHRAVGSIGSGYPQRVVLGRKMPGRMGNRQATLKNLQLVEMDLENQVVMLKGSIPGSKNSIVKIAKS